MSRELTVHCPCGCDHFFKVSVERQNAKGEGAHYAKDIRKLGEMRELILDVLKVNAADSEARGMTLMQIWKETKDAAGQRNIKGAANSHSLSGRMSELKGLKLVEMAPVRIEVQDREELKFRPRNRAEMVYWLAPEDRSLGRFYG